ncbi:MAG: hypothetical protein M1399_04345 [Actinobacteria bacterium]|nr:hypothetical protein [Actinomycetota bacterium]MCL5447493.1 hypothetical protein [Actinomycetota bacterium]
MRLLTAEVKKLAEAQLRTENAQRHTDETVKELVAAQLRTENAQRHTDETVKSLEEMVKELVAAQRHTDETVRALAESVHKLEENVSEVAEESCASVLRAMAYQKGWTVLDTPAPITVAQGEVDVRGRFDTPEGEIMILAEAKSRLREKHIEKWASRVGDPAWREKFLYPGFKGTVLPYMYGTLVYSEAFVKAEQHGIGVIKYDGEHLAPHPL